ncbi:tristetraproline [Loa loa]|uniref:Tristetraproline n=2 Tax=Loa loa TaxID=7209 RepID=A0A1S0U5D9_LOALO|nr:tristetraproline [Loa loa]EFO25371.1 tristetraproline [Loa loa]
MNVVMERKVLGEKSQDFSLKTSLSLTDFHNNDLYIWQWFQFIYQSQLLLAERKQKRKAETHKTVPCQAWKDTGRCNYGKRCKFAHGPEELRPMPKAEVKVFNNPRYRTALCIKYTTFGYCPYGDQCHFIHDPVRIDLEKCLDWLSGSSLSSPQLSPEQTDDYLDNTSFSGTKSEAVQLEKCRKKSQLELTTESECSKAKLSSSWGSESMSSIEIVLENDVIEATAPHDPFRSDKVCSEEIELKPLQFNVYDDFLDIINSQSVLPKK